MPVLAKLSKYKNLPIALIFNGANALGIQLTHLLIEQGAFTILIDEYTQKKKNKVSSLLNKEHFCFIDLSGLKALVNNIEKLDYIFYLNHYNYNPKEEVSTSNFLNKSNTLDLLLELGIEKGCKFLITSSIQIHQELQVKKDIISDFEIEDSLVYTTLEVQRYAENLTWEYHKRGGLDARIIRIGELLGEGIDTDQNTILINSIKSAILGEKLEVESDGLDNQYFVHVLDAAYGLLKALFTSHTSGNIYSLTIPRDITVLNLVYKILDLEPRAGGIDFIEKKGKSVLKIYKPAKNLKEIGWKPKVSFERALSQTIDYMYTIYGKKKVHKREVDKEKNTDLAALSDKEIKPKKSLKDFIINFFFEVKKEEKPKSVLDNVKYSQYNKNALNEEPSLNFNNRVYLSTFKHNALKSKRSKLKSLTWSILNKVKNLKDYLRTLTLKNLAGYSILILFLVLIYVFFLVPFIRITYFSVITYINVNKSVDLIHKQDFNNASINLFKASQALDETSKNIEKYSILKHFKFYRDIDVINNKISKVRNNVKGYYEISKNLSSLGEYLNNYESNLTIDGEGSLSVVDNSVYDLESLNNIDQVIKVNKELINQDGIIFNENDIKTPLIGNYLSKLQGDFSSIYNDLNSFLNISSIIPTLLAIPEQETYVLLMLNDKALNTRGGEIEAVSVFKIAQGKIIDIKVYSKDEIPLNLTLEQERMLMNKLKFMYPASGLKFKDLTLIFDEETFVSLLKTAINRVYKTIPDHIITINTNSIKEILNLTGTIDLNNKGSLGVSNYDDKIDEGDTNYKELLSKLILRLSQYKKEDLGNFGNLLSNNIKDKDLSLYTNNSSYVDYLNNKELSIETQEDYDYFNLSYLSYKTSIPAVEVKAKYNLSNECLYEYKISFSLQNTEEAEGIYTIQLRDNVEITSIDSSSDKVSLASSYAGIIFINVKLLEGDDEFIVIKGKSPNIVIDSEKSYNYYLNLIKPYGFDYTYSIILDYNTNLELTTSPSDSIKSNTTIKQEGNISKDILWFYKFTPK